MGACCPGRCSRPGGGAGLAEPPLAVPLKRSFRRPPGALRPPSPVRFSATGWRGLARVRALFDLRMQPD
eukprot:5929592-Lingulodinium_polyedra.AAC.1